MCIKNGVHKIKKVGSCIFEIINVLSPLLYMVLILSYLFKPNLIVEDIMWFVFALVMYSVGKITDAINKLKEK